MRIDSFEPSEYTSPCGTIRVRKVGTTWDAEARDYADHWQPVLVSAGHTHVQAIARALDALGLGDDHEPPPERPDPEDELRW